jgi:hypothetical protein
MRWQIFLSWFNFKLVYRPRSQAFRSNALSRQPQDMPKDRNDDRLTYRDRVLLPQGVRMHSVQVPRMVIPVAQVLTNKD